MTAIEPDGFDLDAFGRFTLEHAETITNALRVYAQRMHGNAMEAYAVSMWLAGDAMHESASKATLVADGMDDMLYPPDPTDSSE